ncbi:hypothetical protein CBR_g49685 [Chara braunii]|uniref:Uncharacterized protein n=1 Tax=Chara braunii TaxID=69332 RepID=A0A388M5L9_CHABU|nr:hypothetical protein CBR_g49685 [Chara braunii]|eukprot:GBG89836.1 hypothetical protein CBR_g49685 [Chara braunii]
MAANTAVTIQSGSGCMSCLQGVTASRQLTGRRSKVSMLCGPSEAPGVSYIGLARSYVLAHTSKELRPSLLMPVRAGRQNRRQDPQQTLTVFADGSYRRGEGAGSGNFAAGFLLGGLVFGVLGFVFAPQLSKTLLGENADGTPRRLPRWMDDEDSLEATRQSLNDKIAQLNAAIDDVSAQLRVDDGLTINEAEKQLESAT